MGRMRIKKKGDFKPFRQTMAYRLLLVLTSILVFLYTIYRVVLSLVAKNTPAFVIALAAGVVCVICLFYNLERAMHMPIPERKRYR
jgi:hypothetical protein